MAYRPRRVVRIIKFDQLVRAQLREVTRLVRVVHGGADVEAARLSEASDDLLADAAGGAGDENGASHVGVARRRKAGERELGKRSYAEGVNAKSV